MKKGIMFDAFKGSKKSMVQLVALIIVGIFALFGASGFIKFLVSDKSPYIFAGLFGLILLWSLKRRQG